MLIREGILFMNDHQDRFRINIRVLKKEASSGSAFFRYARLYYALLMLDITSRLMQGL